GKAERVASYRHAKFLFLPRFSRGPRKPGPRKSQLKICRMSASPTERGLRMLVHEYNRSADCCFRFAHSHVFGSATSWQDNSHYVALGTRTGYYIVRRGSSLSDQLGIDGAPTVDTADPFNHGYGADALALRFSRASLLP